LERESIIVLFYFFVKKVINFARALSSRNMSHLGDFYTYGTLSWEIPVFVVLCFTTNQKEAHQSCRKKLRNVTLPDQWYFSSSDMR